MLVVASIQSTTDNAVLLGEVSVYAQHGWALFQAFAVRARAGLYNLTLTSPQGSPWEPVGGKPPAISQQYYSIP